MKKSILKSYLMWILAVIISVAGISVPAHAQTVGNIRGKVIDEQGGALPGASVKIKGTNKGVSSSTTGDFQLNDLQPGNYVVTVFYMGYSPVETNVELKAGQTLVQNIRLVASSVALKGVTVSGVIEGQQKALNQQRNADNIKQVISADLMGRFPDLNVAESLQRLPGVTIGREQGEGSTVQLRGTPGGYTNININGEQIMGTQELGQRNAQLDLIPANVLASMEVIKTLTPDLDGDAIAGAINLKTPTAISLKPQLSVDLGGGYNKLRNNSNGIGNISFGRRYGATDDMPNGKLGVTVSGSYYKTNNGYDEINAQAWQKKDFIGNKDSIYFPTDIRLVYLENERTRMGATTTIDYSFSPTTSIVANLTFNSLDNDATRYRKRTRMQTANTTFANGVYTTTRGRGYNEVLDRQMRNSNINFSLEGETMLSKVKLDGGIFLTASNFDQRAAAFNYITGNVPLTITDISGDYIQATGSTDAKNNAALYNYNTIEANDFKTQGRNVVARLNLTYPYKIGDNDAYFKMGAKVKRMSNKRFRPSSTFVANYSGPAGVGSLNNFKGNSELDADFLDNNINFGLNVDKDATIDFFYNNPSYFTQNADQKKISIDAYFYDAQENVVAGYLMNRIQFKRLMLLGGLRVERTDVDYDAKLVNQDKDGFLTSSVPVNSKYNYTKYLPNLQGKYDLAKNTVARGAVSFGYSRPNFNDLVPSRVVSILAQTLTDGNPDLKPAFATNYDLSIEQYLSNLGILSVGAFYKHIDKFQYNSVINLTGTEFPDAAAYKGYQYFKAYNGDLAKVFGVEVNAQTNLTFLPGILKGISLYANYTYTHSRADALGRTKLRLPGQADHTANGSVSYTLKGFTLQGNLNYNGAYTSTLGTDDATDVIRAARYQLDVNASYRITKKLTIYAEGVNLTNQPQVEYFGERSRIFTNTFYDFSARAGLKYRY
ncbi:TonB-dependent receptor [Pedobacter heparinus]|uniref:TonB-dependent receptor n=1 Tax=Pedobacter heparinus (strain ATCC 13125 / DSM 2366 / CIP 104194 / JCM 7457 / NBRC 12017 / NCIMB 9290 / NRRL B-14731 / HIM 762-3) TaxID=485917 RepID=C6Y382_PEDHD|nr:TonB-dependent receptor [Pedobacter heparinus]ACU05307.1 TonB-dependent receptor [Pedobacter heparinus DSM 2366]